MPMRRKPSKSRRDARKEEFSLPSDLRREEERFPARRRRPKVKKDAG